MSEAIATLLRRGEPISFLLPGHTPMYGVVTGEILYGPYGQRLIPIRTTAGHRLHPKGALFCAPAASLRRRRRGRHAGTRRRWWSLARA